MVGIPRPRGEDLGRPARLACGERGELRTCHPLAFRAIFDPCTDARTVTESEGEDGAVRFQEWGEHRLRWLRASLPDDVELDSGSLHTLRPIPVLAAVVSREPHPGWVEKLMSDGRLWRDRRSYYIHAGGSRVTIGPDDYLVIDAEGKAEAYDRDTFSSLFSPYETARCEVARDDVFLEVAYHEGGLRFATGYVSGWGGLRWRLSADEEGEGDLTVFGRDVDEDDGPLDLWTVETSIDGELARRAMGKDGPCVRSEGQMELAGDVAEALSLMDVSVLRRSLLDELMSTDPLPLGRKVR